MRERTRPAKSEGRKVKWATSVLRSLISLESAEDDTDIGLEMEAIDTRLWCESEHELLRTGEPKKLDHGLLPLTRLLSEPRLL